MTSHLLFLHTFLLKARAELLSEVSLQITCSLQPEIFTVSLAYRDRPTKELRQKAITLTRTELSCSQLPLDQKYLDSILNRITLSQEVTK